MAVIGDLVSGAFGAAVIVSHRVVLKLLVSAMLGLDNSYFWNFRLDTAGTTVFSHHDRSIPLSRHHVTAYLDLLGGGRRAEF